MISSIITLFFASLLRIRISRQIFEYSEKKAFFMTTISTIISIIILTLLSLLYTSQIVTNLYYSILLWVIIIAWVSIPVARNRLVWRIIQSIIRFTQMIWWYNSYAMAARSEESIKRWYIKQYTSWHIGTVLLLWIVSGIVFWRTENIIYGIMWYIHNDIAISIVSKRAFVPIILHSGTICWSGLISYRIAQKRSPLLWWAIWLWSGILLHYVFNMSQIQWYHSAIILILLICIWAISYSLFRSDTLYIPKESTAN